MPVFSPINDCAIVIPRAEDGANRAPELRARILRKRFSGALLDQVLEAPNDLLEIIDGELHVREIVVAVALVLEVLDHALEWLVIFAARFCTPITTSPTYLQKRRYDIPGKTRVVRLLRDDLDTLSFIEVEDGVHHSGMESRRRADRNEQGPFFVTSFLPTAFSTLAERGLDLCIESARIVALIFRKIVQTSVVIVNPGGTGSPIRVISGG